MAQLSPVDPWPKYEHNARNTARTPNFGPHVVPFLRWWGEAGFGFDETCDDYGQENVRAGPAIVKLNGTRFILIPGNFDGTAGAGDPALRVFRFHPCDEEYSVCAGPAPYVAKYVLGSAPEWVLSTPLVVRRTIEEEEHVRVFIQTDQRIHCLEISHSSEYCDDFNIEPIWTWPDEGDGEFYSVSSSPAIGNEYSNNSGLDLVFVIGNRVATSDITGSVVALDPDAATAAAALVWERTIPHLAAGACLSSPAVGPVDEADPEYPEYRNMVYLTTNFAGSPEFYGVYADGGDSMGTDIHSADISSCGYWENGSYASPAVFDDGGTYDGDVVVASDDGGVYAVENKATVSHTFDMRTSVLCTGSNPVGDSFSGGGVVFRSRHSVWVSEWGAAVRVSDPGGGASLAEQGRRSTGYTGGELWTWAHAVGDDADRYYSASITGRVRGFKNDTDGTGAIQIDWNAQQYKANCLSIDEVSYQLQDAFEGAPAIDEDGTLIVVNRGYILALRTLVGDMNGDGCRNNYDIDPFVDAILDAEDWQANNPGINLLGVGDINNDGVFNNEDIDPFVDLILEGALCAPGYITPGAATYPVCENICESECKEDLEGMEQQMMRAAAPPDIYVPDIDLAEVMDSLTFLMSLRP